MVARARIGGDTELATGAGQYGAEAAPARGATPAWYDVTWNPTAGCTPVSPGCDRCEALRTVAQLARMGGKGGARYAGLTTIDRGSPRWTGEIYVRADVATWPLLQRRPRRILVDSLSDLFHERLEIAAIDALHAVMTIAHWHRFLVLTRRAGRMRDYYADPQTPQRIAAEIEKLSATVLPGPRSSPRPDANGVGAPRAAGAAVRRCWVAGLSRVVRQSDATTGVAKPAGLDPWPLPNLWLGVSVEDQDRADRIAELLQTPAALRWVRFEPLLGPVRPDVVPVGNDGYADALTGDRFSIDGRGRRIPLPGSPLPPLDWVIAGGETGAGARPTDLDWVRELRDRCVAAGVPFFFRQWGEWAPAADDRTGQPPIRRGRRAAGRLIDGRSWNETPPAMREHVRRSA